MVREGAATLKRILTCLKSATPPGAYHLCTLRVEICSAACRQNVPSEAERGHMGGGICDLLFSAQLRSLGILVGSPQMLAQFRHSGEKKKDQSQ